MKYKQLNIMFKIGNDLLFEFYFFQNFFGGYDFEFSM